MDESNKEVSVHSAGEKVMSLGDSVSIGFSPNNCHVFEGRGQVFEKLAA